MTRYYKFLIVNVLVFFCVGTAALQSFLNSFRSTSRINVINTVATSFPTAGPFYVGWHEWISFSSLWVEALIVLSLVIFTTAMHGGFELTLRKFSSPLSSPKLTSNHCILVGVCISKLHIFAWGSNAHLHIATPYPIPYDLTASDTVCISLFEPSFKFWLLLERRKRAVGTRPRTFNFYCESSLIAHQQSQLKPSFLRLATKSCSRYPRFAFVFGPQPIRLAVWSTILLCPIRFVYL